MTTQQSGTAGAGMSISVVMSVYNGERHLREAVESILNQTFADFEFIIVNDGSTDLTLEVLNSYNDERIILLTQENSGVTKALNNGIALAQGKYVARQDADDVSKPERLQRQFEYMEAHREVGLLGTRFEFIDEFGQVKRQGILPVENKVLQERLKVINQFSHGSVLIRKEALDRVGTYRDFFKYAQDYDLWLRIAEQYEVVNLPDFLFLYRELDQAISSNKILSQSLYAGIAAAMARQRRENGSDSLQDGLVPELPKVQTLSRDLHQKLTNFYTENPQEMLRNLRDGTHYQDMVFLFEQVCAEKQQCQAELGNRNKIINDVEGRTRNIVTEQVNRQLTQMDASFSELAEVVTGRQASQLQVKEDLIRIKYEEAAGLSLKVEDLTRQLELAKQGTIKVQQQEREMVRLLELANRENAGLKSQVQELTCSLHEAQGKIQQGLLEIATRDGRISQLNEDVAHGEGVRADQEAKLALSVAETKRSETDLEVKTLELADLEDQLRRVTEGALIEKLRLDAELEQKIRLLEETRESLARLHEQKELQSAEVIRRDGLIRELELTVTVTEQRMEELRSLSEQELALNNQRLLDLQQELHTASGSLLKLEAELLDKSQGLRELAEGIARVKEEKETATRGHEQRIAELETHIDEILNSKSWKVTAPLRTVGSMLLRK